MTIGVIADMCARMSAPVDWGDQQHNQVCADRDRGPPSAQADIVIIFLLTKDALLFKYHVELDDV